MNIVPYFLIFGYFLPLIYGLGGRGSIPGSDKDAFLVSTSSRPVWVPPNLLSNGYRRYSCRGMKLTTHLHQMPRLGMLGAIAPLAKYIFIEWRLVK
jgi:hypothetical protein